MGTLLVHITHGPEAPTRAALGMLVARAAIEEGHQVTRFLAGDGALLIGDVVIDSLAGLGTGSLGDSFAAVRAAGANILVSGGSSKARGVTQADLDGKNARFASPTELVNLGGHRVDTHVRRGSLSRG